jgi:Ser/Thr protein kinase RdoA (MazF antagonist)
MGGMCKGRAAVYTPAAEVYGVITGSFDALSPEAALGAVERAHGVSLDGTMESYPSYVNRVYGLRAETGERFVVKFYRPGRWTPHQVLDEHAFLLDCAAEEIPVIAPLPGTDGLTLHETTVDDERGPRPYSFALFPRAGGRDFETESEDSLARLGGLLGRCHAVGARRAAPFRSVCSPAALTAGFVAELRDEGLVHPTSRDEFFALCEETLAAIEPLFAGVPLQRIHGDCHRGNIIDRPGTGLALIDFDDMMSGPAVQDLWLVLPGRLGESREQLDWLLDAYEAFAPFDRSTLGLVEPLRFMRMVYFLAWRARQRNDYWFRDHFPQWGTEAFWIKETEDLREQVTVLRDTLDEAR